MVAKKGQKKAIESINAKIHMLIKSGKTLLGYKQCLKSIRAQKAKMVIISKNCPTLVKSQIEYYALLSKSKDAEQCKVLTYTGDNNDLGTACGKYFRVSMLAITESGDSDILALSQE